MSIMTFSTQDILRSKLLPPGWYRIRIDKCDIKMSNKGDSQNYILNGVILFNADTGDKSVAGVPTPFWLFNSKAPGMAVGLWEALGIKIEEGTRVDWSALNGSGKEIDAFIKNEDYEGRMVNSLKANMYRAPRAAATT